MRGIVIGDEESVKAFRLIGLDGIRVSSPEEMKRALMNALKRKDVAIILLTDNYASEIKDLISEIRMKYSVPLVCEIPSREIFKRGTYTDIFYKDILREVLGIKI